MLQGPTKYWLVTAKAFRLDAPTTVLARADR